MSTLKQVVRLFPLQPCWLWILPLLLSQPDLSVAYAQDDNTIYLPLVAYGAPSIFIAAEPPADVPGVQAPPVISFFTPLAGAPGIVVTINGRNLNDVLEVTFNDVPASYTIVSGGQLQATAPAGAASGPIRVTNQSGSAVSLQRFIFILSTRLKQASPLYAGPSNDGYPILAMLPAGRTLLPTAQFGDFVKASVGGQQGFIWAGAITGLPAGLPTLPNASLPLQERVIVPSNTPLVFDLIDPNAYRVYPIFGTATSAAADITLEVETSVQPGADAPIDGAHGVYFGRYERRLYLVYQLGRWVLVYGEGDQYPIVTPFPTLTDLHVSLTLQLSQQNRMATVLLPNGQTLQTDLGKSIWAPEETLYLFAQTAPASTTTLHEVKIKQATGRYFEALELATPLRDLAMARGITLGALPDGEWFGTVADRQIFDRHANLMVRHLDWKVASPDPNFTADFVEKVSATQLAHAQVQGQRLRTHPLLWYADIPDWVNNGNYTPAQLETILRDRIQQQMTRYPADEWVVVNEAVVDETNAVTPLRDNIFYRAFGEQYLDMAFRFAREADPNAVLIYNDYHIEVDNPKTERTYQLLQRMLARGAPVDALGSQFHLFGCTGGSIPSKADYVRTLARFAELGLDIYITELDVNLWGFPALSQPEKWVLQAQVYGDVTAACLESSACKSVTLWGLHDPASWWYTFPQCGDAPLIFDNPYNPKPAFFAIEQALRVSPPIAVIKATDTAPTIDGEIDAVWNNAIPYSIQHVILDSQSGASDLSGQFRALYDANRLYLLVEVNDDTLQNDSGKQWQDDDAVEIYLDGDQSLSPQYDGVNDYQIIFRWGDPRVQTGPHSRQAPGTQRELIQTATGYRLEVAIQRTATKLTGGPIGLDVQITDDDDGGVRDDKLAWHATVDEAWRTPSLFGRGELAGVTHIRQTLSPPVIDGQVDALWAHATPHTLFNTVIGEPVPATDLAGSFRAFHDDTYLYFMVDVQDDNRQNDSFGEWWEDDAIEIYLDGDQSRGMVYDGVNDYQLVFRWNDATIAVGPNSLPAPDGVRWAFANTAIGYRTEVAIPFAALGIKPNKAFGFDLHIADDDNGGPRENKLTWNAPADETWRNPSFFGQAQFD